MKRLLLSLLILFPIFLAGQIINVPADFPTIQEGIDAAVPGDTVLVQPGVYYEHLIWNDKEITLASLYLTSLDSNHIIQTIIDGDSAGVPVSVYNIGEGSSLIGFTICNGYQDPESGGGIEINNAFLSLDHMIFKNNSAINGGGLFSFGSDVFISYSSFHDNHAVDKGGGISASNSNYWVEHCIFENNSAASAASAYISVSGMEPIISTVEFSSCILTNNIAEFQTSGIYLRRNVMNTIMQAEIKNCNFMNNHGGSSGVLQMRGDSLFFNIENCKIIENTVNTYTAGVALLQGCSGEVVNCMFASNAAAIGGGSWNTGGLGIWGSVEASVHNCTFVFNTASFGAGLTVGPACTVYSKNCIFWGNSNQQIAIVDMNELGGSLLIDYSDVEYGIDSIRVDPNSQLTWADHNISGDPLFTGSGSNPYAIGDDSPCIDTGAPDPDSTLPAYDILGNVRIWDGNGSGSAIVDMGAYEYGAPIYVGMLDEPHKYEEPALITKIYPNPCAETIHIRYDHINASMAGYIVYNNNGEVVLQQFMHSAGRGEKVLDIGHLPSGLYFIYIFTESRSLTAKFIKH